MNEVPGPFEAEFGKPVQLEVGLEGAANPVPVFDIRAGPTGVYPVGCVDP